MAAALCPAMLPVRGKTQEMFLKIFRNIFGVRHKRCAWQNESTFGQHDHDSNVSAASFPHFACPLVNVHRYNTCSWQGRKRRRRNTPWSWMKWMEWLGTKIEAGCR